MELFPQLKSLCKGKYVHVLYAVFFSYLNMVGSENILKTSKKPCQGKFRSAFR